MRKNGFTLIELLVSMAIFITVSGMVVTVLFTAFRVTKKSEVLVSIKQTGNTAVSQMVNQIRYAGRLTTPASCVGSVTQSSITIISILDNAQTTFSCPAGASTSITSNSASLVDTNSVTVSGCSFTCSQPTLNDPPTITIQFTLTARNASNLVDSSGSIPFQTAVTLRNFAR